MALLDRIADEHRALTATKAVPLAAGQLTPVPAGYQPGWGGNIPTYPMTFPGFADRQPGTMALLNDEQRAKLVVTNSWVYSDISVIAQEVSTATLVVKRQEEGEEATDIAAHPLELLWERPNPFMGRTFLMQFWVWQLLLSGEGYLFAAPNDDGEIAELWPVPSFLIEPIPSDTDFISGYYFRSPSNPAHPLTIPREHIIYSRIPHPFDLRRGLAPLVAAFLPAQVDLAQAGWNRAFFSEHNAMPANIVSLAKDMGKTDFSRVVEELRSFFGGGQRRTLFTRAGEIDVKMLQFNPEQMQFISMRTQNRDEIDRVFGIPGGFWSGDANRANAQHGNAVFIGQAVWPKLTLLAEDLNAQFVEHWYGDALAVEFEDIRPRNIEQELRQRESRKAYLTIDELRADDGYEEIGDARGKLLVAEVTPQQPPPADAPPALTDSGTEAQRQADAAPQVVPDDSADPLKADLARWERKALKALKARGRAHCNFASDHIPAAQQAAIRAGLTEATTVAAVKAVFAARVQGKDVETLLDDELLARVEALLAEVQDG